MSLCSQWYCQGQWFPKALQAARNKMIYQFKQQVRTSCFIMLSESTNPTRHHTTGLHLHLKQWGTETEGRSGAIRGYTERWVCYTSAIRWILEVTETPWFALRSCNPQAKGEDLCKPTSEVWLQASISTATLDHLPLPHLEKISEGFRDGELEVVRWLLGRCRANHSLSWRVSTIASCGAWGRQHNSSGSPSWLSTVAASWWRPWGEWGRDLSGASLMVHGIILCIGHPPSTLAKSSWGPEPAYYLVKLVWLAPRAFLSKQRKLQVHKYFRIKARNYI